VLWQPFEIPKAVLVSPEVWTPENGFLTPTYKIKRDVVRRHFQQQLDALYAKLGKTKSKGFNL
jgi:long-chain acyl-CoA synthetase